MSSGGQNSTMVGLPQNNITPTMGTLGVGGGIYGNSLQVSQYSQPSGLTLQGQGAQQPTDLQSVISQFLAQKPQLFQQQAIAPYFRNAPAFQGQNAIPNQPVGMQAGLRSLIPGNYASQQ